MQRGRRRGNRKEKQEPGTRQSQEALMVYENRVCREVEKEEMDFRRDLAPK